MKKEEVDKIPDVKVQGWKVKDLANESVNKESDEILKEVLSGADAQPDPQIPDVKAFQSKKGKDGKLND